VVSSPERQTAVNEDENTCDGFLEVWIPRGGLISATTVEPEVQVKGRVVLLHTI
jgi:hypothetical protein